MNTACTALATAILTATRTLVDLVYGNRMAFENRNYVPFSGKRFDGCFLYHEGEIVSYVHITKDGKLMLASVDFEIDHEENWVDNHCICNGYTAHCFPIEQFGENELRMVALWLNEYISKIIKDIDEMKIREEEERKRREAEEAKLAKMTFMERYAYQVLGMKDGFVKKSL